MFPEHILTVRATVEPAHEEEFNRWYNEEHIPDVLKLIPGCLGGARYRVLDGDGSHQYMAVYRFASEAALRSALQGSDARGCRLRAALGAVLVRDNAPDLRLMHGWFDNWSGLGPAVAAAAAGPGNSMRPRAAREV